MNNETKAKEEEIRQCREYENALSKENILKHLVIKHVLEISRGYLLTREIKGGEKGILEGLMSLVPHNGCIIQVPFSEISLNEYSISEKEAWEIAERNTQEQSKK